MAFVNVFLTPLWPPLQFTLGDPDRTLASLAGSDPVLQVALESAESIKTSSRTVGGQIYQDFEVLGPTRYLASITVLEGRIFALFVGGPEKVSSSP